MIREIPPNLRGFKLMGFRFSSATYTTEQALAWVNGHGFACVEAAEEFNATVIAIEPRRSFHPTGFRPLYRGVRIELDAGPDVKAIYGMRRGTGNEAPRP